MRNGKILREFSPLFLVRFVKIMQIFKPVLKDKFLKKLPVI